MRCIQKVRNWIDAHNLIPPRSRIIAAVSGGPDSMALLTILKELSGERDFELAAAHFDHGIRPAAASEKTLVERYTASLDVPLLFGSGDVPTEARKRKKGLEEMARLLRYRFLEGASQNWNADGVALGHTRDDQIETILHHIVRGTGWRGMTGIPVRRGMFIRPLLSCTRKELTDFLRRRQIRYAIDESNRDNRLLRNRIRNLLLPYLRKNYNPSIDESLIRLQENLVEGWGVLEQSLRTFVPRKEGEEVVSIPLERLSVLSDFQIYLLIDLILREQFDVTQDMEKVHFDAAKRLIRSSQSGRRVKFPHGITIHREQTVIRLTRERKRHHPPVQPEEIILPGTGTYSLPRRNLSVTIETIECTGTRIRSNEREAYFSSLHFPIRVRNRKPGDRIVPLGMKGRKKLSDLFIDRKVSLHRREQIPVFEDANGIFWIPGVAIDERTRVRPQTRKVIHIKLSRQ